MLPSQSGSTTGSSAGGAVPLSAKTLSSAYREVAWRFPAGATLGGYDEDGGLTATAVVRPFSAHPLITMTLKDSKKPVVFTAVPWREPVVRPVLAS